MLEMIKQAEKNEKDSVAENIVVVGRDNAILQCKECSEEDNCVCMLACDEDESI